ncbi:MAG: hypothetical protein HXK65_01440 [Clostridiales bacterium]|nr:hypothetical protein [Clostridiales bacterium]
MVKSYQKILDMESMIMLRLEQNRKKLDNIRQILYHEKDSIINTLIKYLKIELNKDYFKYKIIDINNNIADILVSQDSEIFKNLIQENDFFEFNIEDLIDNKIFNNQEEIIIIDLNFEDKKINLGYLCDSLNYKNLSYSERLKNALTYFIDLVINKKINNNIYKKAEKR